MGKRLELHDELLEFLPNAYYQPPSNIQLTYPCIIYNKSGKSSRYGNNNIYIGNQQYNLIVIDRNPDSTVADDIEKHFTHCAITGNYVVDNLNHTSLTLFY